MSTLSPESDTTKPKILYEARSHLVGGVAIGGGRAMLNIYPSTLPQLKRVCIVSVLAGRPNAEVTERFRLHHAGIDSYIGTALRLRGAVRNRAPLLKVFLDSGLLVIDKMGEPDHFPLSDRQLTAVRSMEAGTNQNKAGPQNPDSAVYGELQEQYPGMSLQGIVVAAALSGQLGHATGVLAKYNGPYLEDTVTGFPLMEPPDGLPYAAPLSD